jgi:hypothetical protein
VSRAAKYTISGLVAFGLFAIIIGSPWMIEAPYSLIVGWVHYLIRIVPMVRINVSAVAVFVIAIPVTLVLGHWFLSWLWRGMGNARAWRWKWSVGGLSGLMLMFVIGTAATGIVHQTGWLITSPKPLVVSSFSRSKANGIKCASNLREIGSAVRRYQQLSPGFRPTNLSELTAAAFDGETTPDIFICPSSDIDSKPPGTQPAEWTAAMVAHPQLHFAYVLAPPSTLGPDGQRAVLIYEPLDNHEEGINVLYEEGDVQWLDEPAARAWLEAVGAER